MFLHVVIEEQEYRIQIPEQILKDGEDFFRRMDRDMDKGWQMGREWVEKPDTLQRCQIAADRIADGMHSENETLVNLMAGYIVNRMPGIKKAYIATDGEMMETRLV